MFPVAQLMGLVMIGLVAAVFGLRPLRVIHCIAIGLSAGILVWIFNGPFTFFLSKPPTGWEFALLGFLPVFLTGVAFAVLFHWRSLNDIDFEPFILLIYAFLLFFFGALALGALALFERLGG